LSEEICNEYAAHTMSCQSQTFQTEKYRCCLDFFAFQKKPSALKESISKFGTKKA